MNAFFVRPATALCWREILRFLKQRSRIVGAMLTPVLFWLLLGAGMGRSFVESGVAGEASSEGYLVYFFPGALLMIVLFVALFSTISIIEDRKEGFMQGVLAAPVSAWAIVAGKAAGATILAAFQGMLFVALAAAGGIGISWIGALGALLAMLLIAPALAGAGMCLAWWMESVSGFHAIMNVLLMPLWMLSGAMFPLAGAATGMQWVMLANPLTYAQALLRRMMQPGGVFSADLPSLEWSLLVTVGFSVLMLVFAWLLVRRRCGT